MAEPHAPSPGQLLAGKYRVERVLGQGGMGVVVGATNIALGQRVALKLLLPEALGDADLVARFEREARAASSLESEHVARVIDVGRLESGVPFLVMEFLEGRDLDALVRSGERLEIERAVDLVLEACDAIAEAHSLGIVHRDLKPSNLFLARRRDGTEIVKVLDFGISKATGRSPSGTELGMTRTSAFLGSPLYMSPEHLASTKGVDARTDIWALGAILFELLAGRPPFMADTLALLHIGILQYPPAPLRELRPDLPPQLEAVVLRCLEKDRDRRFSDVAELAAALAPFASRRAQRSVDRISRVLDGPAPPDPLRTFADEPAARELRLGKSQAATGASWGRTEPRDTARRSWWPWAAAGLLSLAALAAGARWFLADTTSSASPVAPASAAPSGQLAASATSASAPAPLPPPPASGDAGPAGPSKPDAGQQASPGGRGGPRSSPTKKGQADAPRAPTTTPDSIQ